ncbi:MAG: hypothetical protein AAGF12_40640 [Myxococcota bacterium]
MTRQTRAITDEDAWLSLPEKQRKPDAAMRHYNELLAQQSSGAIDFALRLIDAPVSSPTKSARLFATAVRSAVKLARAEASDRLFTAYLNTGKATKKIEAELRTAVERMPAEVAKAKAALEAFVDGGNVDGGNVDGNNVDGVLDETDWAYVCRILADQVALTPIAACAKQGRFLAESDWRGVMMDPLPPADLFRPYIYWTRTEGHATAQAPRSESSRYMDGRGRPEEEGPS